MESARTKRILSIILLFPDPFGPDITVNPSKNGIFVFLKNDLKLSISSSLIYKDGAPAYFFDDSLSSSSATIRLLFLGSDEDPVFLRLANPADATI